MYVCMRACSRVHNVVEVLYLVARVLQSRRHYFSFIAWIDLDVINLSKVDYLFHAAPAQSFDETEFDSDNSDSLALESRYARRSHWKLPMYYYSSRKMFAPNFYDIPTRYKRIIIFLKYHNFQQWLDLGKQMRI